MTAQTNNVDARKEHSGARLPARPSLGRRLLRALPVLGVLLILTWIFGHSGVLHKLETIVSDADMRLNPPPTDSPVAIVNINDDDYRNLFVGTSPLDPALLQTLISDIAKGEPAVIGIDIDTSSPRFATQFKLESWTPRIVWEKELRQIPDETTGNAPLEPLATLGGRRI